MGYEVETFLSLAKRHLERAKEFEREGKTKPAAESYRAAAEYLLKAARLSSGRLKKIRLENAKKLLERAKSLKNTRAKAPEGALGRGEEAEEAVKFFPMERPSVTFKDVVGLEDVKREIKLRIIYPFAYPDKAREYGIKRGGGLLLYGPPGCGKTFIAKAVAGEIDAPFFAIKPSELLSKWFGESEQRIAKLFETARTQERAVIFIDEIEALLPKRGGVSSSVMKRVVPQILAELDGVDTDNSNLLFIGATNIPWELDPAVLRPGRFDRKIYVPPPDLEMREALFRKYLSVQKLSRDVDFRRLAEATEGFSVADIVGVCNRAKDLAFLDFVEKGQEREITMEDVLKAVKETGPSIDEKMLEKYRSWAKRTGFF